MRRRMFPRALILTALLALPVFAQEAKTEAEREAAKTKNKRNNSNSTSPSPPRRRMLSFSG
jgi:hypothetical protein